MLGTLSRCHGDAPGVSGRGVEDGRRVGDTACDEAVDVICSPAPSSSSSVTLVLCLLPSQLACTLLQFYRFVFIDFVDTFLFAFRVSKTPF